VNRIESQSNLYTDMVVSHLRSQIVAMHNVLETIERTHNYEDDYIAESIKTVETELRRLRKYIEA